MTKTLLDEHRGRQRRHTGIVRISSYSVATVLALLATTATLPPLLADQSDRAVINAPIQLLTAPIAGQVVSMSATIGQTLQPNQVVAQIENNRVDRTTLITLESKRDDLEGSLRASKQKRESDNASVDSLDAEIRRQVEQTTVGLRSEIAEEKAKVAAAAAEEASTQAVVNRQQSMVDRNAASIDLLRPTQSKLDAAKFEKAAQSAQLNQRQAELDSLQRGVFVGNRFNSLAVLAQKRRDLAIDAGRLTIEEQQLSAALASQQTLYAAEEKRLATLTRSSLVAEQGGVLLSRSVMPGRHVSPGDSVATLVDCSQSFAVGIFSYRQASELAVGTPVRITASGNDVPRRGTVSEILPKTSDKTDDQYAVPFPQTERREMYVLVSLDHDAVAAERTGTATVSRTSPCSVGQWVTITRENGWVPSASVAWKTVAAGVTGPEAHAAWTMISNAVQQTGQGIEALATSDQAKRAYAKVSEHAANAAEAAENGLRSLAARIFARNERGEPRPIRPASASDDVRRDASKS